MTKARVRYGVVLNDLQLPVGDFHPLGEGWELRKASDQELAQFKPVVENLYNAVALSLRPTPPPHEAEIFASGAGTTFQWGSLQPSEWRYWTVHRTGPHGLSADGLIEALALSDTEIAVDYWPNGEPYPPPGRQPRIANPTAMSRFFHDVLGWDNATQVADLDEMRGLVKLRSDFKVAEHPEIHRILKLFTATAEIHDRSRQKFLAHLAIIEGLLTHRQKRGDPSDSIGQQLRRTIVELDKSMPAQQNCGLDTFGATVPEKVISELYNYRSAIAHGKDADSALGIFKTKWPEPLTALELHRFARTLTRRILTQALRDPALVTKLRG